MAININSNTVVRVIVRRGTDIERQYSTLATGELGYTIDTKRLFVGDGAHQGGVVVGNVFLGSVTNISDISQAQVGDTAYESSTGSLYAFQADNSWLQVGTTNTLTESFAGVGFNYALSPSSISNIYNAENSIQLNSTYWSLCAFRGLGLASPGGFFFGNVANNTWNIDYARAVCDGPLFINGGSATQIQLSAANSALVNFANNGGTGLTTFQTNSAFIFTSTTSTGTSSNPGFIFTGNATNGAVLIQGNLFVTGTAFYANVTTTYSSVTTLSADTTGHASLTALTVNNSDTPSHGTVLVNISNNTRPVMYVDTAPFVSFNTRYNPAYSTYNFVASGAALFTNTLTVSGNTSIVGDLSSTGDIIAFSTSDQTLKTNITPIYSALDKLLSIKGVEFDWKKDSIYSGHDVGVLAQDVEKVLPTAVKSRHDGIKHVNYDKIIPLLIEAVRELKQSK